MREFYKLLFDLTLCYEIFGFYFKILFKAEPCIGGFLLLISMILLDIFLRSRNLNHGFLKILPLFLPLAVFYYRPTLWQLIQLIPAWVYVGYSIYSGRVAVDYDEFKTHYAFAGKIQFILLLGIIGWNRVPGALLVAIPYLLLMLVSGVCLLRMLREKEQKGSRQAIFMGCFILISALLTMGRAPQLVITVLKFIYTNAIAPILMGAAMAVSMVAYVFVIALRWLLSVSKNKGPNPPSQESPPAWYDASRNYEITPVNVEWLKYVIIVIGVLIAGFIVFLIMRKMISEGKEEEQDTKKYDEEEIIEIRKEKPLGFLGIRPRNPRLAVRFYYAKFLVECNKRIPDLSKGLTAAELSTISASKFPGTDPSILSSIYAPARYSNRELITTKDVEQAAAAWKELKRAKQETNTK